MASIIKADTLQSTTSNVFVLNSAGTEYARFDASGNMGIGTASPGAKLDVRGSSTFLINSTNPTAWISSDSGLTTQSMYMQVNTTSSDTRVGSYTSHPLVFLTNNAERMRINAGAPILCLSGGSTTATGTGIAFPATQSASADANTLDDYEEGTWTPSVLFGGAAVGQTGTFAGFYTKVGNQVFATCLINLTAKGSSTGYVSIGGLPFTSNSNTNYRASSSSITWQTLATSYVYMLGLLPQNTASIDIYAATAATADSPGVALSNTNVNNTSAFRISITYQTS